VPNIFQLDVESDGGLFMIGVPRKRKKNSRTFGGYFLQKTFI
jgi:hypothetical protein